MNLAGKEKALVAVGLIGLVWYFWSGSSSAAGSGSGGGGQAADTSAPAPAPAPAPSVANPTANTYTPSALESAIVSVNGWAGGVLNSASSAISSVVGFGTSGGLIGRLFG